MAKRIFEIARELLGKWAHAEEMAWQDGVTSEAQEDECERALKAEVEKFTAEINALEQVEGKSTEVING